jgi:hypothetical protein
MFKKNFFIYCAIAAGVVTLVLFNSLTYYLVDRWEDGWLIGWALMPSLQLFGALTLLGLTKAIMPNLFFRILSVFILIIAIFVALLYLAGGLDSMWLADLLIPILVKLFGDEDTGFGISIMSYFYLVPILGIGGLIYRKWLPAVCLLMIPLPILVGRFAYQVVPDWLITNLTGILPAAAWFIIAWWMKKENETIASPEALELDAASS